MNQRSNGAVISEAPNSLAVAGAPDRILTTINGAGAMIGVSRSSIYKLADAGKIETVKVLGRRMIVVDSLRRLASSGAEAI